MSDHVLKSIVEELDFDLAFRRVKQNSVFDFLQLPIEVEIFERYFDENIKFLKEAINQGDYKTKSLRRIWVPKRGYFLRPGSIPYLDDRILFQGVVDKVASRIEAQLLPLREEVVFSHRLNPKLRSENMYLHPKSLWLSFQKKAINYCNASDVKFVLVIDIASYFENIDLRLLNDSLTSSGVSPNYAGAIRQILSKWANGRTKGIPQMIAPCSLLANLYLSQVDKNMVMHGHRYIRYVDDIRIFVSTEVEARKALLELTKELRACYLDIQTSKTKFFTADEHKKDLTSLKRHLTEIGIDLNEGAMIFNEGSGISALESPIASDNDDFEDDEDVTREISEGSLIRFLNKLLSNSQYDDRHLRFCINRLGRIGSPAALDTVLSKLYSMPQETENFVRYYLSRLPANLITAQAIDQIIEFLESEYNIYDWQMMWLLIFLVRYQTITTHQIRRLFRIEKLKQHFINRAILSYLLCSKGDLATQRNFMELYRQEQNNEVKMAILCGVYDLEKKERNRFYELAKENLQTTHLIELLKNKKVEFC
jgi:retron-type reverse transcriptase